jgi:methionyl-tRNA synthetase
MAEKYFAMNIKAVNLPRFGEEKKRVDSVIASLDPLFEAMQPHRYLEELWKLFAIGNKAVNDFKPWEKMRDGKDDQVAELLVFIANLLAKGALLLAPIMPKNCDLIAKALGVTIDAPTRKALIDQGGWIAAFELKKQEPLFARIDAPRLAETTIAADADGEKTNLISIDEFKKVELKVGAIIEAKRVEKSDKLLVLRVDLGEEKPRQIVAGIGEFYAPETLVGTQACVVANLKPAKLMGFESRGMILAIRDENGLRLARPEAPSVNGTPIK